MKAVLALLAVCIGTVFAGTALPQPEHEPESEIRDVLERMERAWGAADASAYAELFTQDGTFVVINGLLLDGRDQIRMGHHAIFKQQFKDTAVHLWPRSFRTIRPDVVAVISTGSILPKDASPAAIAEAEAAPNAIQTFVFTKEPDGWRIQAFQNTELQVPAPGAGAPTTSPRPQ